MDQYTRNRRSSGRIGTVVVLFYALIPVPWIISLSLKTPADDQRRQSFFPPECDVGQLQRRVRARRQLGFNPRADQLDRHRPDHHRCSPVALAAMAAYAITRLRLPGQDADPRRARSRSRCSRRSRWSAACSTSGARLGLYDTWPGLILPYLTVRAAAGDLHAVGASSARSPGTSRKRRRWTARPARRPSGG